MKKIIIPLIIAILNSWTLISQEVLVQKSKEKICNAGSSPAVKTEIPNFYQSESPALKINESREEIPTVSSFSGNGSEMKDNKKSNFFEREDKEGFPVGWITNSKLPIFNNLDDNIYLALNDSLKNVYFGYLFSLNNKAISGVCISFQNSSNVELIITMLNTGNLKNTSEVYTLPVGEHKDYIINIPTNRSNNNLLIKFQKQDSGEFKLFEIKIMEG